MDLQEKSDCETAELVGSHEDGESYAVYSLSNCPDGTLSHACQGWEWGNGIIFHQNTTVKTVMDTLANSQNEHAAILKKFMGEPTEFQDGDYLVKFSVARNEDGTFKEVRVSITSDYHGADYTFIVENGEVLMLYNYGS